MDALLDTLAPDGIVVETHRYNGTPGLLVGHADGRIEVVLVLDVADGLVHGIEVIRNPDKLRHIAPPTGA